MKKLLCILLLSASMINGMIGNNAMRHGMYHARFGNQQNDDLPAAAIGLAVLAGFGAGSLLAFKGLECLHNEHLSDECCLAPATTMMAAGATLIALSSGIVYGIFRFGDKNH